MRATYATNKHNQANSLPTPRKIRRACSKELYRTIKRLGIYIPDKLIEEGEQLYYDKVIGNLLWIAENHSNRKRLADWWDEAVSEELAQLWDVDQERLCSAFRTSFGG